jgi:integrase
VAKEIFAKRRTEIIAGRNDFPTKKPSPLFETVAVEYLKYYKTNRQPKSVERHEMAYRALKPFFAGKRLEDITPFMIEKYKQSRKGEGRSEVTINRELAFLKNFFNQAIIWGKATGNPVRQVRLLREDNQRTRFSTEEEEFRLLAHCHPHLKPLVIAALHTDFRKSELLSLRWTHVDFGQRLIRVEAAYSKTHETRGVPMTERLTRTLKQLRMATISCPEDLVFGYKNVPHTFARAVNRAGIKNFRFHDLRHTFASRLVMAGVDLATVKELLGHANITMTLRYTHLAPGHKRSAIAVLDQVAEKVHTNSTTLSQTYERDAAQVIEK